MKAVLDRKDEELLRSGRIRLAGLAYSKKLFEEIAGEIRKLQGRKLRRQVMKAILDAREWRAAGTGRGSLHTERHCRAPFRWPHQ